MHHAPHRLRLNEFAILGVFVAVAVLGLCHGIFAVSVGYKMPSLENVPLADPIAPSVESYQNDAREVLTPFLEQASAMTAADFTRDVSAMRQMATLTQERLLRLRVPSERRDAHLAFALMIDQWKRALDGSVADQSAAPEALVSLSATYPWLLGE